jgi:hypothetical protein
MVAPLWSFVKGKLEPWPEYWDVFRQGLILELDTAREEMQRAEAVAASQAQTDLYRDMVDDH